MDLDKLKTLHILIVDDSELNITLMGMIFKKWNLRYESARNGAEALELFKEKDFNLIITDIEMPIMRGTGLLRAVRSLEDEEKSRVPVVALTAHNLEEKQRKYFDMGMNDVVVKPCTQESLYSILEKYA